jgi:16S rRNA (guanine527-N7)-methyltransferase
VDNQAAQKALIEGADRLGVRVEPAIADALWRYALLLTKWNSKVNLTSISEPMEIIEKHLVDSLALVPVLGEPGTVLDIGSGAGLPGLVLKVRDPRWQLTLVDSVQKKVAFMKQAIASLGLQGASAVHLKASGSAETDGLSRTEVVVSRAFTEPARWVPFAGGYVQTGGRIVTMLGAAGNRSDLEQLAFGHGLALEQWREYRLPFSGAVRAVAVMRSTAARST